MCDEKEVVAYEIVRIRQNCGLTVLSPLGSRKASSTYQSSKSCLSHVRLNSRYLSPTCPIYSSLKLRQLLLPNFDLASPASTGSAQSERLCCCNYCCRGSTLSLAIRQVLSTLSLNPKNPLKFFKTPSALIYALFFVLVMIISTTSAEISNSASLLKTDATSSHSYGVFDGKAPRSYDSNTKNLDFQTLRILPEWGGLKDVLFISGRDYVYMLNASQTSEGETISYSRRLKWTSGADIKDQCSRVGKSKYQCNNFIRVVEPLGDKLYVCGTNSYKPQCRYYSSQGFDLPGSSSESIHLLNGQCDQQCPCPFDPTTSSVARFSNTSTRNEHLFSGFVNDFLANNPVFLRVNSDKLYSRNDWFNDPMFIKLVEAKNGKMYLFFRETAKSSETGKEQATYGRVAQVCKNDPGGTTILDEQWTSFIKARLLCSIPATSTEPSFTFDNLTSVSDIVTVTGPNGEEMEVVFATFTSPRNWKPLSVSAVCMYKIKEFENVFEKGRYLKTQTLYFEPVRTARTLTKDVPVLASKVPNPRPGKCSTERTRVPDKTQKFARDHFLMYDSVTPLYNRPIFISEPNVRATRIVVDNDHRNKPLVAYVGTENGKVLRIRPDLQRVERPESLVLEEMSVAEQEDCRMGRIPCEILDMNLYRPSSASAQPRLFVAFTDRLVRLPLSQCSEYINADCCNVDPDCGWSYNKCYLRSENPRRSFPPISPFSNNLRKCQLLKSSDCTLEDIKEFVELCKSNNDDDRSSDNNNKQRPGKVGRPHRHRTDSRSDRNPSNRIDVVSARSFGSKRKGSVNDRPNSPAVLNRRGCEDIRFDRGSGSSGSEEEITNLFIKHILPSISSDFGETVQTLQDNDRHAALLQQLRTAMVETTRMVLNNYRMDHCLPTQSVNSLVHTYPLLLRDIERWHELAWGKMIPDSRRSCWERTGSDCIAKISFSVSFAPTLWGPLTNLIQEFGGNCDPVGPLPNQEPNPGECHTLPGVLPCKDEMGTNSSICRVRKCRFSEYAVDVKAFFRHVNDTRNFLSAENGIEPFRKTVTRNITENKTIQNHLELVVGPTTPFQILYIPANEKVKITFHYSQIYDCAMNQNGCSTVGDSCNPKLERKLTKWFNSFMKKLVDDTKRCTNQIRKANIGNERTGENQSRRKRTSFDNRPVVLPKKCLFMKKTFKLSSKLWEPLVRRGRSHEARYYEAQKRLVFYMKSDVINFFEQQCSDDPSWSQKRKNLIRAVQRRRHRSRSQLVDVEIFVSNSTPFVIERSRPGRLTIKFFTAIAR